MFFNEPQQTTLIVVCKDELLINQLKKYVETNDDKDEENVVGTKDGSVKIVAWNEKVWLDNKKAGNIASKVLLIGNVKGVDKLIPIIDVKYNEYGIKYGWAGNQAILIVDPKALSNEADYDAFFEALQKTAVSETYQQKVEMGKKVKKEAEEPANENSEVAPSDTDVEKKTVEEKNKGKKYFKALGQAFAAVIDSIGVGIGALVQVTIKSFGNKEKVEKQQFIYGITKLYENHLAEFLR